MLGVICRNILGITCQVLGNMMLLLAALAQEHIMPCLAMYGFHFLCRVVFPLGKRKQFQVQPTCPTMYIIMHPPQMA